jgi:hypothetical protein
MSVCIVNKTGHTISVQGNTHGGTFSKVSTSIGPNQSKTFVSKVGSGRIFNFNRDVDSVMEARLYNGTYTVTSHGISGVGNWVPNPYNYPP